LGGKTPEKRIFLGPRGFSPKKGPLFWETLSNGNGGGIFTPRGGALKRGAQKGRVEGLFIKKAPPV